MSIHDLMCFHRQDTFHLQIFAFLEPADLCRISRVCRRWYSVSCDASLWRRRLEYDIHKWSVVGHSTNPNFYAENESDLSFKEMYVCCNWFFITPLLTAVTLTVFLEFLLFVHNAYCDRPITFGFRFIKKTLGAVRFLFRSALEEPAVSYKAEPNQVCGLVQFFRRLDKFKVL
jgi:F-box-like